MTQTTWPGYENWRSCYSVTIPTAWITSGAYSEDFAVLDFKSACGGLEPGTSAGHHPVAIGIADDYWNGDVMLQAYDGTPWPSYPAQTIERPMFPTLLDRYSYAQSCWLAEDWRVKCVNNIDLTSGASGGGFITDNTSEW